MDQHPESDKINLEPQIKDETVQELCQEVEKAISDRSEWEHKQRVFYERRYGIRDDKNFPLP